ncbi:hypothetical protein PAL_GLEAN10004787 [Pteropus alecto]|uniref:Uncharacterized protein n=1 Tax=Pteropus alecto TaxID=9402 RepID=L5L0D2_PTEAL|nr:hypothetical protein PAL_GLEAN10004787 [Pteropus alecto]
MLIEGSGLAAEDLGRSRPLRWKLWAVGFSRRSFSALLLPVRRASFQSELRRGPLSPRRPEKVVWLPPFLASSAGTRRASRLVPEDQLFFTAPPDPRFSGDSGRIQLLQGDPEAAPVRHAGLCGVASRCTRREETARRAGQSTLPPAGTVRRLEAAGGPSSAASVAIPQAVPAPPLPGEVEVAGCSAPSGMGEREESLGRGGPRCPGVLWVMFEP